MESTNLQRNKSITDYHRFIGLEDPANSLISVVSFESMRQLPEKVASIVNDFYSIALKRGFKAKMKYGQQEYDFTEGILAFVSPGQVIRIEAGEDRQHAGLLLLVHPDFLWNTPLARTIRQHEFFDYAVHEALHLSTEEEAVIAALMLQIDGECRIGADSFSQPVMIAQLELLLMYAERYYHRQFLTRKVPHHEILDRFEAVLADYFSDGSIREGLPSVQGVASALNVSPCYLSNMLKALTGQNAQQHIQEKLIEKAKVRLSTTTLSVSEIAYELGFEHSQSFSRLFKNKTQLSPLEFRESFIQ